MIPKNAVAVAWAIIAIICFIFVGKTIQKVIMCYRSPDAFGCTDDYEHGLYRGIDYDEE